MQAERFIHGFRRDNLAIEVVEVEPRQRAELTAELLLDHERRPAIVYAPTRAQSTGLAVELGAKFPCAAYHAGLLISNACWRGTPHDERLGLTLPS